MNAKRMARLGLKVIVLTFILLVCHMVAPAVAGVSVPSPEPGSTPANTGMVLAALLVVSLSETAVLTAIILRSRWSGWRLVGAVFLAFYGLNTVVTQIESIVYLTHRLPPGMIPRFFAMGAVVAGLFSPLAVLVLGKMRRESTPQGPNRRWAMPAGEWAWKLAAIAATYVILYYTFGYFVAWKNPAVQAYYGGTDPGSFLAQMAWITDTTPWMFPLQALRAVLWTAFALPVIRMHKGQPWEVSLAVAALSAVWSIQLLVPNPMMPEAVARAHLVETISANFIFGGIVGWLLSRRHGSPRDLPRRSMGLTGLPGGRAIAGSGPAPADGSLLVTETE